jgi:hypothetical protein
MNRRILRFVGFQPDTLLKEASAIGSGKWEVGSRKSEVGSKELFFLPSAFHLPFSFRLPLSPLENGTLFLSEVIKVAFSNGVSDFFPSEA